ncbi:MAG: RNA polymerase sigma factor [Deltaproteobacteria bacterium]|nr:MAG: RNA polymerase sigma factor [Deltaproteobacteria bacterium]
MHESRMQDIGDQGWDVKPCLFLVFAVRSMLLERCFSDLSRVTWVEGYKTVESKAEEQALVERAQQGDREAVAAIYRLYADRLYRQVIYPCVPNAAMAEDILKETFVTMLEQIHRYRWDPSRGLFPWLATIARNRGLDRHRKRIRHDRLNGSYREHLDVLASLSSTPDKVLEEQEEQGILKEQVRSCLDQLNERYRAVLEMRMFQELSREECAEQLDIRVATLDVVYFRALKAFKKVWEKQHVTSAG